MSFNLREALATDQWLNMISNMHWPPLGGAGILAIIAATAEAAPVDCGLVKPCGVVAGGGEIKHQTGAFDGDSGPKDLRISGRDQLFSMGWAVVL